MGRFDAVDSIEAHGGYFDKPGFTYVCEFNGAREKKTLKHDRAMVYSWTVLATDDPECGAGSEKEMIDGCVEYYGKAYWAIRMMQYARTLARAANVDAPTTGDEFEELAKCSWEPFAGQVVQITTTDTGKSNDKGEPIARANVAGLSPAGKALLGGVEPAAPGTTMPAPSERKRFGG